MKLSDIPEGSIIYENVVSMQEVDGKQKKVKAKAIRFHHLDGMYSYCTAIDKHGEDIQLKDGPVVVHISRSQPLKKHKDGYKLIVDKESLA